MGVDASMYCVYGIEWEGPTWEEDYDVDTILYDKENDCIKYNYTWFDNKRFKLLVEPYGACWTILGVEFLSGDLQETINNLKRVQESWQELVNILRSVGYEEEVPEPSILYDGYFS